MDNASDSDLKQVVEDPADAPLVEAAGNELESDDVESSPKEHGDASDSDEQ